MRKNSAHRPVEWRRPRTPHHQYRISELPDFLVNSDLYRRYAAEYTVGDVSEIAAGQFPLEIYGGSSRGEFYGTGIYRESSDPLTEAVCREWADECAGQNKPIQPTRQHDCPACGERSYLAGGLYGVLRFCQVCSYSYGGLYTAQQFVWNIHFLLTLAAKARGWFTENFPLPAGYNSASKLAPVACSADDQPALGTHLTALPMARFLTMVFGENHGASYSCADNMWIVPASKHADRDEGCVVVWQDRSLHPRPDHEAAESLGAARLAPAVIATGQGSSVEYRS
jgi:hypothetical protein